VPLSPSSIIWYRSPAGWPPRTEIAPEPYARFEYGTNFLSTWVRPNGLTCSDEIWFGNTRGELHVLGGQTTPPSQRKRGPASPYLGDPSTSAYTVGPRATKFGTITDVGEKRGSRTPATPRPKGWGPCVFKILRMKMRAHAQYEKQQPNFAWWSN